MSRYTGQARLVDRAGTEVKAVVEVDLTDEPDSDRTRSRSAPFRGEFWVREGDLMDPLRERAHCVLELSNGTALEVHVDTFTHGGSRAQCTGEGSALPPWVS